MKVIVDFKDFSGGAPKSHLEHCLLLKELGYSPIITIGRDEHKLIKNLNKINVEKINFEFKCFNRYFELNKPFNNLYLLIRWLNFLRKEKPVLIYSNRTNQYKFLSLCSILLNIPLIFAQAGNVVKYSNIMPMQKFPSILYSVENYLSFKKINFKSNVLLFPNRLRIYDKYEELAEYFSSHDNDKILLIGNIKENTFNGIINFLKKLNYIKFKNKKHIVEIAGLYLMDDLFYFKEAINQISQNLVVNYVGFIEMEKILEYKVIIGKGRSIIEPALYGKVCFVLSEDGNVTILDEFNLSNLAKYNFSGRQFKNDSFDKLLDIINLSDVYEMALINAKNLKPKIINYYVIDENSKKKFVEFIHQEIKKFKKHQFYKRLFIFILQFFKIYFFKLKYQNKVVNSF